MKKSKKSLVAVIGVIAAFMMLGASPVMAQVTDEFIDFGTDAGKQSYTNAGFSFFAENATPTVTDVADAVQLSTPDRLTMGLERTFAGLGESLTDPFIITMEMTLNTFPTNLSHRRLMGIRMYGAEGDRTSGITARLYARSGAPDDLAFGVGYEANYSTVDMEFEFNGSEIEEGATYTFTVDGTFTSGTNLTLVLTVSDGFHSQSLTNDLFTSADLDGDYFGVIGDAEQLVNIDFFNVEGVEVVDNIPPSVPSLPSAVPGADSVSLDWADSIDEGTGVFYYNIYRSTTSESYVDPAITNVTASAYVDSDVVNGTEYFYKISAVDGNENESGLSTEVSATPFPDTAPPSVPFGLTAIADVGAVSLEWIESTDDYSGVAYYNIYRSTTSGSYLDPAITNVITTNYVDSDVVNGTTYYYAVSAVDGSASTNESALSAEASATPIADPNPPSVPANLAAVDGDGGVSLNWDDSTDDLSGVASYNIYRSTTSGSYLDPAITNVTVSGYVDVDVVNGITYYYKVSAVDGSVNSNESGLSSEASGTPDEFPDSVIFGSINDGYGGFLLSPPTGTMVWSLPLDSVNYTHGVVGSDEGQTASLLRSYELARSVGSTYTMEGVVDLTAGYGDDNNRIGILLFNTSPAQTSDGGGGLFLMLNTDNNDDVGIWDGINGAPLDGGKSGEIAGDLWIGQTLTYTADIVFTNTGGTNFIDVSFELTASGGSNYNFNAVVAEADYPGNYFGFATKWRQRGDPSSNRDVPPIFNYKSFSVSGAPDFVSPVITSISISGGNVTISGTSDAANAGAEYRLQSATDLTLPSWVPVATNAFDGSGNFSTPPIPASEDEEFYRLEVGP